MIELRGDEVYQGFTLTWSTERDSSLRTVGCFLDAERAGRLAFRLDMRLTIQYGRRLGLETPEQFHAAAVDHARRWAHGLIDLGRYEEGATYSELRSPSWDPLFGEDALDEEGLRRSLLETLQRMGRAQAGTSAVLRLDVGGIADVLGLRTDTVRAVLGELIAEGLVEPYAESFTYHAEDGACRITGAGLRYLRRPPRPPAPLFATVDEIDSFAEVRKVPPQAVAGLLDHRGLLRCSEDEVKSAIQAIVGEVFEHKDWGGERSDVFTTQVVYRGRRVPTAMLLKGGAVGPVLYPSGLGKRGDQDLRLFTEPAELVIVQFNGKIDAAVRQRVQQLAENYAARGDRRTVCLVDGVDTARLLRAYGYLRS